MKNDQQEDRYDLSLLPKRLAEKRALTGLSQYWFAAQAGIREKSYWQYENGATSPPLKKLIALANTHGFDLNELFEE